jgi:hypothetical protein
LRRFGFELYEDEIICLFKTLSCNGKAALEIDLQHCRKFLAPPRDLSLHSSPPALKRASSAKATSRFSLLKQSLPVQHSNEDISKGTLMIVKNSLPVTA